jgi:hypothetical protein
VGRRRLDRLIGEGGGGEGGGGGLSVVSATGGRVIIVGATGGWRGDGGWNAANGCSGGIGLLAVEFGVADTEGVGGNLGGGAGDGKAAALYEGRPAAPFVTRPLPHQRRRRLGFRGKEELVPVAGSLREESRSGGRRLRGERGGTRGRGPRGERKRVAAASVAANPKYPCSLMSSFIIHRGSLLRHLHALNVACLCLDLPMLRRILFLF